MIVMIEKAELARSGALIAELWAGERTNQEGGWAGTGKLTPKHLFRQLEPSLFFSGQTTSLLASVTENELVMDARGGMVCMNP